MDQSSQTTHYSKISMPNLVSKLHSRLFRAVLLVGITIASGALAQDKLEPNRLEAGFALKPIDLAPFASCISHWRNIRDESRFIKSEENQPSYEATQVEKIVANIILFQRSNGGWPKDYDVTAILTSAQQEIVAATRENSDTSYDELLRLVDHEGGWIGRLTRSVPAKPPGIGEFEIRIQNEVVVVRE
jgi:hypothetical protein